MYLKKHINIALTVVLALSVLAVSSILLYLIFTGGTTQKFTEFYIIGLDGKAGNYPVETTVNESNRIILGIVNHEGTATVYFVDLVINGARVEKIGPIYLEVEEKWEKEIRFVVKDIGPDQKVEFLLHREGLQEAYRSLLLYVNVKERIQDSDGREVCGVLELSTEG